MNLPDCSREYEIALTSGAAASEQDNLHIQCVQHNKWLSHDEAVFGVVPLLRFSEVLQVERVGDLEARIGFLVTRTVVYQFRMDNKHAIDT